MADQDNNIPYGYCQCGCGQETRLAPWTNATRGWRKGEPIRFIHGHNTIAAPTNWNGGRYERRGYIMILCPNHPRASSGYVPEHILVMEKALKRYILPTEAVHHIDGNKSNNNIGNLILFKESKMHTAFHQRLRAFKACGHWDWRQCGYCHQWDKPSNLYNYKNNYRHSKCVVEYNKQLSLK